MTNNQQTVEKITCNHSPSGISKSKPHWGFILPSLSEYCPEIKNNEFEEDMRKKGTQFTVGCT